MDMAKAKAAIGKRRAEYEAAWETLQDEIQAATPKGTKVFEARHRFENARRKFLADAMQGKEPSDCGRAA